MKGKHRNMWRTVIALALTFTLVFGTASTAFAASQTNAGGVGEKSPAPADTINYVSLGDSMTNGYGLPGYETENGANVNGYLQNDTNAYTVQFAKHLEDVTGKTVDHTQLAISCMRAEDLRFALELDYDDEAVIDFINEIHDADKDYASIEAKWDELGLAGDKFTYDEFVDRRFADWGDATDNPEYTTLDYAEQFQTSVAEADVITMAQGNSNFGVFLLHRLVDALGIFGKKTSTYDWISVEDAIVELDPEAQKIAMDLYEDLKVRISNDELDAVIDTETLAELITYTTVSYMINYKGALDRIAELNDGADIMLVGLLNIMSGMKLDVDGEIIPLGDYMDLVYQSMNNYLAGLATVMQVMDEPAYDDHNFLFAEVTDLENADMIVSELKTASDNDWAGYSTVRDRIVTEVNSTVFGLLGMGLPSIDIAKIESFEDLSSVEKVAFAQTNPSQATANSIYLGFEKATVAASEIDTLDGASFIKLATGIGDVFDGVFDDYEKNVSEDIVVSINSGEGYWEDAAAIMNEQIDGMNFKPPVPGVPEIPARTVLEGAYGTENALQELLKDYVNNGKDAVVVKVANAVAAIVTQGQIHDYTLLDDMIQQPGMANMVKELVDETAKAVFEGFKSIYTLLDTPDALSKALVEDETVYGLLNLFARFMVGNGIGCHPSQAGHDKMAAEVIKTYDENYTVYHETYENLKLLVTEYYDEAYEYAYDYAEQEGYIDATIKGIKEVENALAVALKEAKASGMSDELKAELEAAYKGALETTAQLEKLIKEADVLDEATYNEAMALVAKLEGNLNDFCSVAEQVGVDSVKQLKKAYEYLKPIVIEQLKIAIEKGTEWLMKKIGEAYDAFVEWLINEGLPGMDKALYDWLYENPETVINFFIEYGDDMAPFVDKYGDDVTKILVYVLYTYGPEAVEWALENPEEAIDKWVQWYNKHGHKVWPMIEKYLKTMDEMGMFDDVKKALNDAYAELEAYVIAYAEKVVAELEAMVDELNDAAKAALEDLIEAIEAAKNGADNAVADILAALEALYNEGVAIWDGATSGYYAATDDSYYVALGDTNVEYAQIVADELDLDKDQFVNYGIEDMTAAELKAYLNAGDEDLIAEIEKADLITLGFSNNTVTKFAADTLAAVMDGEDVNFDWTPYVGKEGAAVMDKAIAAIEKALVAEGVDAATIDMVAAVVEAYAFACTEFTCNYPEAINTIKAINPEAQVVVVGMYNPFENAVLEVEGTEVPVGDFVGVLVDLANVHYTSYALLTGNAIYVHAPAVETKAPFEEAMGIEGFASVLTDLDSLEPSAAGHEYIANQILDAMNVVSKAVYDAQKLIEEIAAFGDVTRENLADARALADAARDAWNKLTDEEKELIGLENYKVLVDFELAVAKVELGVAEDIAAAEKALAEAEAKVAEIANALKITESTVANLKAKVVNKSQIKVTWKAPETTPDQYRVALIRDGKKVGTYWVAGTKNTVTLKNLLRGTNFTVRVTPVAKVDGQKYFSIYKTTGKVKTQLQKANLTVKKAGLKKQIISKDQNSTGFQIYISKDKNFKKDVKKLVYKTNKKGLNVKVKAKNFKKGTNYVKVRAYTKVNGKTVYGAWSGTVKVTK